MKSQDVDFAEVGRVYSPRLPLSERRASTAAKCLKFEEHLDAVSGRKAMTTEQSPVLEVPAMLYGTTAAILRKVRATGQGWAHPVGGSLPCRVSAPLAER